MYLGGRPFGKMEPFCDDSANMAGTNSGEARTVFRKRTQQGAVGTVESTYLKAVESSGVLVRMLFSGYILGNLIGYRQVGNQLHVDMCDDTPNPICHNVAVPPTSTYLQIQSARRYEVV